MFFFDGYGFPRAVLLLVYASKDANKRLDSRASLPTGSIDLLESLFDLRLVPNSRINAD